MVINDASSSKSTVRSPWENEELPKSKIYVTSLLGDEVTRSVTICVGYNIIMLILNNYLFTLLITWKFVRKNFKTLSQIVIRCHFGFVWTDLFVYVLAFYFYAHRILLYIDALQIQSMHNVIHKYQTYFLLSAHENKFYVCT